ncbi:MAG: flagellar export protein FliJ [Deferribacterales bacterium]
MKREFRLQKVLEYRERIVTIEKAKLADLHTRLLENRNSILAIQNEASAKLTEMETADTAILFMYDKYLKSLAEKKAALVKMKKQIEMTIELQKKKVMEAIDRHKVMEKLKEKHVENFRSYLNKEEMKLIDELAISRSARNNE